MPVTLSTIKRSAGGNGRVRTEEGDGGEWKNG